MTPTKIQAGITAEWQESIPVHLNGFTFQYILKGPASITIPATASGYEIAVNITAADTANWTPGTYRYQLVASQGDNAHLVTTGSIEIAADFSALADGTDFRSHAEIMLDAIKQVLEGRITKDVEAYEIDGRSITRIPILELMKLKRQYAMQVQKEKRQLSGKPAFKPRTVKTRFNR